MKSRITTIFVLFVLLATAVFAAEELDYKYYDQVTGILLASGTTEAVTLVDDTPVDIENVTWNIELVNNNSRFKVLLKDIDIDTYPKLHINATDVDINDPTYLGEFSLA
ncbi:hypothetical protein ACFL0V_03490, partial [Nanoarchaeota archaeon]